MAEVSFLKFRRPRNSSSEPKPCRSAQRSMYSFISAMTSNPFWWIAVQTCTASAPHKSALTAASPSCTPVETERSNCGNTAEQIAALGVEGLTPFIQTIGLYRNKAKNVVRLSEILRDEYAGEVPEDFDKLVALPGVGRKTANVVLNVAFGHPTIPVDTHIFRVSNRTGLAKGKTPDEIETKLEKIIPDAYKHEAHHWLLLHGRYCCKARSPECERCPVAQWCNAPEKKKRLADFGSPSKSE